MRSTNRSPAPLLDQQPRVHALQRLDHHQLRPQQADPVDRQARHPLQLRGLGEVDEDLGPGHRRRRGSSGSARRLRGARRGRRGRSLGDDALAGVDRDQLAVAQDLGRLGGADHAGDAELAGDDRRVAGHPAGVGDDRRRLAHQRHPVGRGHVGDENLAVEQPVGAGERADHPHRPVGDAGSRPEPAHEHGAALLLRLVQRLAAARGDRAGLQHPDRAGARRSPTRCPGRSRSASRCGRRARRRCAPPRRSAPAVRPRARSSSRVLVPPPGSGSIVSSLRRTSRCRIVSLSLPTT